VKITQTKFVLFATLLLLLPSFVSASDVTSYQLNGTSGDLYQAVPVIAGDNVFVTHYMSINGANCNDTNKYSQINLGTYSTTTVATAYTRERDNACSASTHYNYVATTTLTVGVVGSSGGYGTEAGLSILKFTASSGGTSATTTVDLPASADAANNMLTFFLAFLIFVVSALFVMYLVKRFTD